MTNTQNERMDAMNASERRAYYYNRNIQKYREYGRNCYAKHAEENRKRTVERRIRSGVGQIKLETLLKYGIDVSTIPSERIKV